MSLSQQAQQQTKCLVNNETTICLYVKLTIVNVTQSNTQVTALTIQMRLESKLLWRLNINICSHFSPLSQC